jgi:hypothetical protein
MPMTDDYSALTETTRFSRSRSPSCWRAEDWARVVDDNGDWLCEVGHNVGADENQIDTTPVEWVRQPELTDLDGSSPSDVLTAPANGPR